MVPGEPCKADTERWHQTLKNPICLENYFPPGDLEARFEAFAEHYNHQQYDACFGRAPAIIKRRERITKQEIEYSHLLHRRLVA